MNKKIDTLIMKGKPVSDKIMEGLISRIEELKSLTGRSPGLAVILVGEDPASQVYVRLKGKMADKIGIETHDYRLPSEVSFLEISNLIEELNKDSRIDGILVQLPLPSTLDETEILKKVDPRKDVDVFHTENFGKLSLKQPGPKSCTPAGVLEILKFYNFAIEGKRVVIIGRSKIVGLPLSILLLHENATVTICHSRTENIAEVTRSADILIAAVGRANFVNAQMVKEGAIVVDVGTNRLDDKLVGDCDFSSLIGKVSAITPVPGGVGPMTISMLMVNTVNSFEDHVSLT
ncbi:MAG: bifunctional methylenetetrahydrofolate dehydrogenase/methenyltetrahydrofolate cyclohydrolase FolD [Nitrospinota bacterium]|nr:bifunctional methylenetetrahydrofolate dehydrogenase/methenyltetrahydrofolate cyclohydrolase FolD [Nitrospinota bacterium]